MKFIHKFPKLGARHQQSASVPLDCQVRIAVTGHRWNKIDPGRRVELASMLRRAFSQTDERLLGRKRLVCGMAEGTDLIAALNRPDDWELEAVLPLPLDEWRAHIASIAHIEDVEALDQAIATSTVNVLPHPNGPDYVALARYLAETCDVLFAVWDGKSGNPGGTASVIRLASGRGLQVIVLPPPGSD